WVSALALLFAATAAADPIDQVERQFGATNVNAALGDGHLTAGVAATGELTVLRWPGPGSPDHVRYVTRTEAAPGQSARSLPHFGAAPEMGLFAGLALDGKVEWLRDAPWSASQRYASDTSPVLVTTYRREGGPTVVQEDFVLYG